MYKTNPNVYLVDSLYSAYHEDNIFKKNLNTQNYRHWRKSIDEYLGADGYLKFPSITELIQSRKNLISKKKNLQRSGNPWTAIGPFETLSTDGNLTKVSWQANVYTIDQSNSNENIIYAGTEAGGVFKSIDKGLNWSMTSANTTMSTIRSIKVDPTNPDIVYAGDGSSIYKTTNGGVDWQVLMTIGGLNVNDIAIHESDPQIVLAGTNAGLYRTSNGGLDWTSIYSESIWDIEQNTVDSDQFYILKSNETEIRTEFWKSTDGGENFTLKDSGWYSSNDPARINGGGRMTVTRADGNRIYVILIGASKAGDNGFIGVYRSEDEGESWTLTDPPVGGPYNDDHHNLATLSNTNTLQQGYYNLGIAASDTDPDVVLIGCLNLWRTTDGGSSFTVLGGYQGNISWIHPDQQEIEINGNDMWVANDGGINYSNDYFETHESRKEGLLATDYWGFGSGWNEDLLVGGRYHNGNSAYRPSFEDGQFLRLGGGEAPTGYVQPGGEQTAFFSDISAKKIPYQLDEAVENVANLSMFPSETYFAAHSSELLFDPNCYGHMIIGRENKLYQSFDNGSTFDLLATLGAVDQPIMSIEQSRINNDVIYVYQRTSFYGAVLWVSQDGGNSWQSKNFPSGISSMRAGVLSINSQDPGILWAAFSHQNNDSNKIWKTEDYGDSWTNITTPILDGERIHTLFHHEGTENDLYAGTNYGIYFHNGTEWSACDNGLPMRLNNNKLLPFYAKNKLRTATYGNGIWETELINTAAPIAQATVNKLSSNCPRDTFYFDDYSILNHDENVNWQWEFSPAPAYFSDLNIRNPKVVFGEIGSFDVSLTVSNNQGESSFYKSEMIQILDDVCRPDNYPGMALECFQSGGDFVQLADMKLSLTEFTMMAWVKPNGVQNEYTGIFFNDNASNGMNFTSNNQLGFHYQNAGSAAWAWQSGLVVPTDEWSHVAMVSDPSGVTLYVNGISARRDLSLEEAQFGFMKLGSYKGWTSRNYNGLMDEVSLWNRALTEQEIREHRHITKNPENADGLITYYQFNETDGSVLDRIGNKHGTLSGLAVRNPSFAPIGGGHSRGRYGLFGVYNFMNTDINVDASSDIEDMLVISKLEIAPQNSDVPNQFPTDRYWIINHYGDIDLENYTLNYLELENYFDNYPEELSLYARPANDSETSFEWEDDAFWVFSEAQDTTGSASFAAQLNDVQFILSKANVSGVNEASETTTLLFPNPTSKTANLVSKIEWSEIQVIDRKGQRVAREIIQSNKINCFQDLPAGVYSYWLISDQKMKAKCENLECRDQKKFSNVSLIQYFI